MKINITDDQTDSIVIWELKRHSKVLKSNIDSLKRRKSLEKFEKEDLERFKKVLAAASLIVEYYSLCDY
jgi:uncharacterized protein YpuA (DUF1002 family)